MIMTKDTKIAEEAQNAELTAIEIAKQRDEQELNDYKARLETITSKDEMLEEEKKIIERDKALKEELFQKFYDLPASVTYNNKTFPRSIVLSYVEKILNKIPVSWQQAEGLLTFIERVRSLKDKIDYGTLTNVLQFLTNARHTGTRELFDCILTMNYFDLLQAEYGCDLQKLEHLADIHNAWMERYELVAPVESRKNETDMDESCDSCCPAPDAE